MINFKKEALIKNRGMDVKMNAKRIFMLTAISALMLVTLTVCVFAAEEDAAMEPPEKWKFLSMAIAVSIPCAGAGYAVALTGTAASASITERPELFGRTIVYVGMAEGIAIYGLLISFLIWIS